MLKKNSLLTRVNKLVSEDKKPTGSTLSTTVDSFYFLMTKPFSMSYQEILEMPICAVNELMKKHKEVVNASKEERDNNKNKRKLKGLKGLKKNGV